MFTIRSKNSDQEGRPFGRESCKRLQASLRPHHSGDGTGITDRKIAVQGGRWGNLAASLLYEEGRKCV